MYSSSKLKGRVLWTHRNMFLAAAPYFQHRFQDSDRILSHFQPAIASVATVANLGSIIILAMMQSKANYINRIVFSLILSLAVFAFLAISTATFDDVSSTTYLNFTLVMVFLSSLATGFCQNGTFAFVSSFGRPEYMQANMVGQAVAGVLPSMAQILAVLAVGQDNPQPSTDPEKPNIGPPPMGPRRSAFIYFMAATAISALTLLTMLPVIRKHNRLIQRRLDSNSNLTAEEAEQVDRKVVPMMTLYKKLYWLAAAVFLCFSVTMFFPVLTTRVLSVIPSDRAPFYLQPQIFIPLSFLTWNIGDLTGRLATSLPFSLHHRPVVLFLLSILRLGFIPLYLLCNLDGDGAVIDSDAFYLGIVQFGFGITNGWLGSSCMMAAGEWVGDAEREATGGFMGVNLVAGLAAGSILSFAAAKGS